MNIWIIKTAGDKIVPDAGLTPTSSSVSATRSQRREALRARHRLRNAADDEPVAQEMLDGESHLRTSQEPWGAYDQESSFSDSRATREADRQEYESNQEAARDSISQRRREQEVAISQNRQASRPDYDSYQPSQRHYATEGDDVFEASQQPSRITYPNGQTNITGVDVGGGRVWDYKTGEYQWADKQADGTLRQRDE